MINGRQREFAERMRRYKREGSSLMEAAIPRSLEELVIKQVQASNQTRLDDSGDRCTVHEAEAVIKDWDALKLLQEISYAFGEVRK